MKLVESLRVVIDGLRRVVTQPRSELTRWQVAVRNAYDLGLYGAHRLRLDRAPQMAAALSFRTLFGLLPVIVLGTIIVKAIGGLQQFQDLAGEFFQSLGMDAVRITPDTAGAGEQTLSEWLLGFIAQVETVNVAAITWVGVAVLVYSAISLMVTIETSFNTICRTTEGRSWLIRLPIYWTVLTLGPAAIVTSIYLSKRVDSWLLAHDPWGTIFKAMAVAWGFLITWLVMTGIYKWVPHAEVSFQGALGGAFVATLMLEVGRRSLGAYLENALSIKQLYGSLGLIPLFMFWVYIMWLMVLFGLEVASALDGLRGRSIAEAGRLSKETGLTDPAAILAVMEVVARRFRESKRASLRLLREETGLPESALDTMLDGLVREGILHRVENADGAVSLSQPPDAVSAEAIARVGFELVGTGRSPSPVLARLREAQLEALARASLEALVSPSKPEGAPT